jgi:hypothetical protein
VRKILGGEEVTESEWDNLAHKLDAPEFWFNEAALRTAFDQPTGSLNDFIRAALGLYRFPTREQRIERAFTTWVAEHSSSINPDQARMLSLLRNVVLASIRDTRHSPLDSSIFKGLWVGGIAPLGYETKERKIVVVEEEAERVRTIFRRYLELGSLNLLMADLRERGIVTKVRSLKTGRTVGGIPFTRGPLAHLLRNRFYIGEVAFKGEVLPGEAFGRDWSGSVVNSGIRSPRRRARAACPVHSGRAPWRS